MIVAFIGDHRDDYGAEPICAMLPISPPTYYAVKACEADPSLCAARAQSDEVLRVEIQRVWDERGSRYGAKKVWKQFRREGLNPVSGKAGSIRCVGGTTLRACSSRCDA